MRPGIKLQCSSNNTEDATEETTENTTKDTTKDTMGQQYKVPEVYPGVCWVVGRNITQAQNPRLVAEQYKNLFCSQFTKWVH